ncbi:MAG: MFS transporter [Acutalibacteraceae bacterium]
MNLTQKVKDGISNVKEHWNTPAKGNYMTYKEILAYSGGGIGAYMIITLGTACLLSTTNTLISSTLGVDPTDAYIMYVIAVLLNIPLTGIRANIIDNTRKKAGKYRPYIVTMAIPTAIITTLMVWFPYARLSDWFGTDIVFGQHGKPLDYVIKCAIIMVLNIALHFFYYFFYDAYENLIHVLSPNTQERANVASIKCIVYSLAPSIINLITPIIANHVFHTNMTDIRVYRLLYPILAVIGILLCIVVYKYTEEKIVQAKTHIVQIKFLDALKAVAKNKYFWIISLATWIGFLETAYINILYWLYNYGGVCSGDAYGVVVTIYGNASLWGMILAPFCIKKWGKKNVLIVTNFMNIGFILLMLPFVNELGTATIWLVLSSLYLNSVIGAFAHILNPSIQADIRDYQQYKTGERIDGMFSAVGTIGTVVTLLTSSVLPVIYKECGLTRENAVKVTSDPTVLNRMLGDGKTVGQILNEQLANGQDNFKNAYSALYDPNILINMLKVLIIVAAFGALLNVLPYFFYDFTETKQKAIVKVLKVRAMFEDFGNGSVTDESLAEGVEIVKTSRELKGAAPVSTERSKYKHLKGKEKRKAKNADSEYNESIKIAEFVCDELDKYNTPQEKCRVELSKKIYDAGLQSLYNANINEIEKDIAAAKAMSKSTKEEKETRKIAVEIAKSRKASYKTVKKYFSDKDFVQPDFTELEKCFEKEDEIEETLNRLYADIRLSKKQNDKAKTKELSALIDENIKLRDKARKETKIQMDKNAYFNRAAKPYMEAERVLKQFESYNNFDEIERYALSR